MRVLSPTQKEFSPCLLRIILLRCESISNSSSPRILGVREANIKLKMTKVYNTNDTSANLERSTDIVLQLVCSSTRASDSVASLIIPIYPKA